jgi:uncharacterized protein (TIGR02147 family)
MLVMQGKRNLGKDSLLKISSGLGLKKKESQYFSYLVFFDQAKSDVEKNYFFTLISAFRSKSQIVNIHADKFNYYDKWYNPVLREIVKYQSAQVDLKAIAESVSPPIMPKEVKKSLKLLQDLELLKVDKFGRMAQTSDLINTDREVQSLAVRNFHKKMSDLGKAAIDNVEPQAREVSSITVRISEKGFDQIKKRIQDFREELLQLVKTDKLDDRVYQLNFQFFPVSKIPLETEP